MKSDDEFSKNQKEKNVNRRRFIQRSLPTAILASASFHLSNVPVVARPFEKRDENVDDNDALRVNPKFRRKQISFVSVEPIGSIIVDPHSKYLYFINGEQRAIRYGVGVGRQGFEWTGEAKIQRKAKWPSWTPTQRMVKRDRFAARWAGGMPGGVSNPLGARALYLFQGGVDTLYRIHGTTQPESIGTAASSGCIRMINADAIDLYDRVDIGAKVIVVSESMLEPAIETAKPPPAPRLDDSTRGLY
jgi:lipoprotein-anchoring transpeptidase ErfK/SrfK